MQESDRKYFDLLKQALSEKYQSNYPHITRPISEWKGQEIVNFQEDLARTVNGRISEKWFYTHLKSSDNPHLPRIDVLNMLSRYVGFADWEAFVTSVAGQRWLREPQPPAGKRWLRLSKPPFLRFSKPLVAGMAAVVLLIVILSNTIKSTDYVFCFVDADDPLPVTGLEVWVLENEQTPRPLAVDAGGCVQIAQNQNEIVLIAKAPYYRPDTIVRRRSSHHAPESIPLRKDDYALMLHYFSTDNLKDWKKRREQLEKIFDDEVRIFQVSPGSMQGMEMYNKEEFIDKMTMPLQSLRNIEVLETDYKNGKINGMRFIQKDP
ncbi:MAG: hypothetical protein SF052_02640 [Bacteroidia bacterium]|nr:hypothetical protein [Bacteroidia bacterium]